MANKKITDLTAAGSLVTTDILEVVSDPGGTPASKKATFAQVKSAIVTTDNSLSVYAAGTAYSLTNASAALDFGTTDPALTINAAGTYRLTARARLDYNAATFIANRNVTLKLRRTNNTAADITNATAGLKTATITTLTYTAGWLTIEADYTTNNTDDIISLFGIIDTVPSAGSIDVVEASIMARRLQV